MRWQVIVFLGTGLVACSGEPARDFSLPKAVSSGAVAEAPRTVNFPSGLYGNVCYSEESGDLGGFEVRFRELEGGAHTMADLVLCEGWCSQVYTSEVVPVGNGFRLSHVEWHTASSGEEVSRHDVEYLLEPHDEGFALRAWFNGVEFSSGGMLKPLDEAYGLAVAEDARETFESQLCSPELENR